MCSAFRVSGQHGGNTRKLGSGAEREGKRLKKTTPKRKHWLAVRARNEARRAGRTHRGWGFSRLDAPSRRKVSQVQIWQGEDPEWALCLGPPVTPPDQVCLEQNRVVTFKLFSDLRRGFDKSLK